MIVELGEYVDAVEALRLAVWFRATVLCEGLSKVDCPAIKPIQETRTLITAMGSAILSLILVALISVVSLDDRILLNKVS